MAFRPSTSAPSESSFVTAQHPFASNPNVKNIDPRIGLAYDPFADHKTSIRAGFAMYHEPVIVAHLRVQAPLPDEPAVRGYSSLQQFPQLVSEFHPARPKPY